MKHARQIAAAAATLEETPSDLDAWLALAQALAASSDEEAAVNAFAALGTAACDLGAVALAVGCARWIDARDHARAASLVDAIAAIHCKGSKRIDWSSVPAPPPPRSKAADSPAAAVESRADALAQAAAAIDSAATSADERAPERLPATPLVRVLEPDDFRALVNVTRHRQCAPGHDVIEIGKPARSLYWIARGAVAVSRGDALLGELGTGAFFGEIALVGGTRRTARVRCRERTWLLEIPAKAIEDIASREPRLAKVLAEYARARLLSNVVRTSELFKRLDDSEKKGLLTRFATRMIPVGERFITREKQNDTLFVLVSGSAEARGAGGAVLAALSPGDAVGEISLVSGQPAIADVVATEPCAVLTLMRSDFDEVAVAHPDLLAEVYKLKLEREAANSASSDTDAMIHDAGDLIV